MEVQQYQSKGALHVSCIRMALGILGKGRLVKNVLEIDHRTRQLSHTGTSMERNK